MKVLHTDPSQNDNSAYNDEYKIPYQDNNLYTIEWDQTKLNKLLNS